MLQIMILSLSARKVNIPAFIVVSATTLFLILFYIWVTKESKVLSIRSAQKTQLRNFTAQGLTAEEIFKLITKEIYKQTEVNIRVVYLDESIKAKVYRKYLWSSARAFETICGISDEMGIQISFAEDMIILRISP